MAIYEVATKHGKQYNGCLEYHKQNKITGNKFEDQNKKPRNKDVNTTYKTMRSRSL